MRLTRRLVFGLDVQVLLSAALFACGLAVGSCSTADEDGQTSPGATKPTHSSTTVSSPPPKPVCDALAAAAAESAEPVLVATLFDRWHEGWLASPALVDLDADGVVEIIAPRDDLLLVWHADGEILLRAQMPGRVWASPVVADLVPTREGLEFAVASRGQILAWDATGAMLDGFPFEWRDEMRSLSAADIQGDGSVELVAVTTSDLEANGQTDILIAIDARGEVVDGFPPNTTGAAGCDDACYVHAGFDQNLALGDVNADGVADILAPQDNAYVSLHEGTGRAFDAAAIFEGRTKFSGIRFMVDYAEAQQGYAEDEDSASQAHFTNTAPAIVDVDGDGKHEIVLLGSLQNAAQSDRERGVGLWVVNADGTRPAAWTTPYVAPDFVDGLWDLGDNIVGQTNQVTPLPLADGTVMFVFAGFDGMLHAVSSENEALWQRRFADGPGVLTGGVSAADLSGDGVVELVLATYSAEAGRAHLYVFGMTGELQHELPLPDRGAMAVPSIGDVDGDGTLEIVVSLKDGVERERQVLIYSVPGSGGNCLPWPTGRGNWARTGFVASN